MGKQAEDRLQLVLRASNFIKTIRTKYLNKKSSRIMETNVLDFTQNVILIHCQFRYYSPVKEGWNMRKKTKKNPGRCLMVWLDWEKISGTRYSTLDLFN